MIPGSLQPCMVEKRLAIPLYLDRFSWSITEFHLSSILKVLWMTIYN